MNEFKLPRSTLDKLPSVILKGVLVALLELADDNGVVTFSVRSLAKSIGMEYQPLRTALKFLYANAVANAVSNAKPTQCLTQITINSIDDYRVCARRQQRKANAVANAAPNAISDKQKPTKFIPPTEQQVAEYVVRMGYHFNPESFIPHYQSKGWKVGNQPMKDWKAACKTWESNWKEKHGEQYYYQIGSSGSAANQQKDCYSTLESATETILCHPDNLDSLFYDR